MDTFTLLHLTIWDIAYGNFQTCVFHSCLGFHVPSCLVHSLLALLALRVSSPRTLHASNPVSVDAYAFQFIMCLHALHIFSPLPLCPSPLASLPICHVSSCPLPHIHTSSAPLPRSLTCHGSHTSSHTTACPHLRPLTTSLTPCGEEGRGGMQRGRGGRRATWRGQGQAEEGLVQHLVVTPSAQFLLVTNRASTRHVELYALQTLSALMSQCD